MTPGGATASGAARRHAAVIGAGWSGLASAIALVDAGWSVRLFDAAPRAGGRARAVTLALGDRQVVLDNGQHLLLGAYAATLALMRRIGVAPAQVLGKTRFELRYPDGFSIAAGRGPAPLHLLAGALGARGISVGNRLALSAWIVRQRRNAWQAANDASALDLLGGHPAQMLERIWDPLCIATMNLPLARASGRIFLNVLRDSLGAAASASDFLLPRRDLSTVLPDAAVDYLRARGAGLRLGHPVHRLAPLAGASGAAGWQIVGRGADPGSSQGADAGASWDVVDGREGRDERDDCDGRDGRDGPDGRADAVIIALPPHRAAALLRAVGHPALEAVVATLERVGSAPISTVYLQYGSRVRLGRPLLALLAQPQRAHYGQVVIDRGWNDPRQAGILAVVISAAGAHQDLTRAQLGAAVAAQLSASLGLSTPLGAAVLRERHATIAPVPGVVRPPSRLPLPGLFLAADAADSPYPSTLEGSVRAGLDAAALAIDGAPLSCAPVRRAPATGARR